MKIFYMPLEPYPERYTVQLSRADDGWIERNWKRYNVPYERVPGHYDMATVKSPLIPAETHAIINKGEVLDAVGRPTWSLQQMKNLLHLVDRGRVREGDCVYFDDYWHPGFSALPYVRSLLNRNIGIYGMIHAQSVDEFDFTYPMRNWMRHFERGIGESYTGAFVTSTGLRDLLIEHKILPSDRIHICGLPYNSEEVKEHWPKNLPTRKPRVIWSSRWDKEKDPAFFLEVVDFVFHNKGRDCKDISFMVTTGQKEMHSNDPELLKLLEKAKNKYPYPFFTVYHCDNKNEYYRNLLESAVQFNCADQDWVSWTLLEATTCGCIPVYPKFRSFPECIPEQYLYEKGNVADAAHMVMEQVSSFLYRDENEGNQTPFIFDRVKSIYTPYDSSWWRMLAVMRGECSFYSKNWGNSND